MTFIFNHAKMYFQKLPAAANLYIGGDYYFARIGLAKNDSN
jgi:hypothetical protein